MIDEILLETEEKMEKAIEVMENRFLNVRAGRANPRILDKIMPEYYGVATPVQQVGNISIPEARMIVIQPWESNLLKEIEKAILMSDIGITPTNDGTAIRLNFPELTEERRKELYKAQKKSMTVVKGKKIGRNDPCPCGSGKKYKQCCGR